VSDENFRTRIQAQIDRQPHFDEYMFVDTNETALMVLLELVEEQEYAADPHEWCHMRPTHLRALLALEAAQAEIENAPGGATGEGS
jgi:hypothetical protein